MSVTGLCQICESAQAIGRCEQCGTIACEAHFDRRLGACAECAQRSEPMGQPGRFYR